MIKDEGIRSIYQVQGEAPDGSIKNIRTSEDGSIKVEIAGGEVASIEKVLASGNIIVGTEEQLINVNTKVTSILVANYSTTSDITMTIGEQNILIGANIATELPINSDVTTIGLVATEADTKMYYIIKSVV